MKLLRGSDLAPEELASLLVRESYLLGFRLNVRTEKVFIVVPNGEPDEIYLRVEKYTNKFAMYVGRGDRRSDWVIARLPASAPEVDGLVSLKLQLHSLNDLRTALRAIAEAEAGLAQARTSRDDVERSPYVRRVREIVTAELGAAIFEDRHFRKQWEDFVAEPRAFTWGAEFDAGRLVAAGAMFRMFSSRRPY